MILLFKRVHFLKKSPSGFLLILLLMHRKVLNVLFFYITAVVHAKEIPIWSWSLDFLWRSDIFTSRRKICMNYYNRKKTFHFSISTNFLSLGGQNRIPFFSWFIETVSEMRKRMNKEPFLGFFECIWKEITICNCRRIFVREVCESYYIFPLEFSESYKCVKLPWFHCQFVLCRSQV